VRAQLTKHGTGIARISGGGRSASAGPWEGFDMKHATTLALAVLAAVFAAAPALATTIIPIPEPTSMSLLAAAAAGGVVAWRVIRRK
jgi:hypothetical protein